MAWPRKAYQMNQYWKRFWTIGNLCANENWDPESFVSAAIDQIRKNHNYVTPKDLVDPRIATAYRAALATATSGSKPVNEWAYLCSQLLHYVVDAKSTENDILMCMLTPFPAWFRVLYDTGQPDPSIIEAYGDNAHHELAHDKRLREFMRRMAPARLRALELSHGSFGDIEAINDITRIQP